MQKGIRGYKVPKTSLKLLTKMNDLDKIDEQKWGKYLLVS